MANTMSEIEVLLAAIECEAISFVPDAKFIVTRHEITFDNGEHLLYKKISEIKRVQGIYREYLYDCEMLQKEKATIEKLLDKLFPAEFMKFGGGYWSMKLFWKWTEDPQLAEMLLALGIGIGRFRLERVDNGRIFIRVVVGS